MAEQQAGSLAGMPREELYRLVWEVPISRLAELYGLSDNGLAKICRRLNVPYPPRGWWAKKAAGHQVKPIPLPKSKEAMTVVTVHRRAPKLSSILIQELAPQAKPALSVSSRLSRPHALVAEWLAEHERRKARVRNDPDAAFRAWAMPKPFTDTEQRKHRIYDALFKALDKHEIKLIDLRSRIRMERDGVAIEFVIRERYARPRPAPVDEKTGATIYSQATGQLVFAFKTGVPGIRKEWSETDRKPLEAMLPDILAALLASIPILIDEKAKQEDRHRRWEETRLEREAVLRRQRQDDERWQSFLEMAARRRQVDMARDLLRDLRAAISSGAMAEEEPANLEWLAWIERRIREADPMSEGAGAVFAELEAIGRD